MKKEHLDLHLKPLEHLQPVDAPPFLFTRIRQAIDARNRELVPTGKVVLAGVAFCALLLVNAVVLFRNNQPMKSKEAAAVNFDLLPDNNIYQ